MKAEIGIKQDDLSAVAHELSKILADEFVLYAKTRNAHWNVEGPNFNTMHKFFENQYEQLDKTMDDVAERIRFLGHYAPASLAKFLELTHLSEMGREKNDSDGFIKQLLEDHERIIKSLREKINQFGSKWHDIGSSDFVTNLMETHERMAWMLRAHIK